MQHLLRHELREGRRVTHVDVAVLLENLGIAFADQEGLGPGPVVQAEYALVGTGRRDGRPGDELRFSAEPTSPISAMSLTMKGSRSVSAIE